MIDNMTFNSFFKSKARIPKDKNTNKAASVKTITVVVRERVANARRI